MADQVGGWDPSYRVAPDFFFWLQAGLVGELVHVPEVLATWRRHSETITISADTLEVIEERLAIRRDYFSLPNLPSEIKALEQEALRNVLFIAALAVFPEFNRPEDRFVVFDRLAWQHDSRAAGHSAESELLAERERANRLEQSLADQMAQVEGLSARVTELERARDETSAELRAQIVNLEAQLDFERKRTLIDRLMAAGRRRPKITDSP
jgi:hypothetical protein